MGVTLIIIVGVCLLIMSILDFKYKAIPSIFPTILILALLILRPQSYYLGLLCLVFAVLLYEFGYFKGRADFKVMAIIGLMMGHLLHFYAFMVITTIYGLCYQLALSLFLKVQKKEEISFIPVFFCVYITLMILIEVIVL